MPASGQRRSAVDLERRHRSAETPAPAAAMQTAGVAPAELRWNATAAAVQTTAEETMSKAIVRSGLVTAVVFGLATAALAAQNQTTLTESQGRLAGAVAADGVRSFKGIP